MEILTLAGARPPHEDVPMDLTTSSRRQLVLHHSSWSHLREDSKHRMETVLQPITKLPADAMMVRSSQTSASRYIPIPKKRHCHALSSPPLSANSPPSSTAWDVSCLFTSEVGCKRARLESPKPSDLVCDLDVRPPSAEDKNTTTTTVITSSSSGGSDKRQGLGAGPARGNGDVVEAGEGVSQSVMRPRQRQRSPHAGTSSVGSPAGIGTSDSDIVPGSHLLTALLQLQTSTAAQGLLPPAALKDTEALLAAVQQSQMLYYTYCSQLIQNLRAKQLEQQQQKRLHHHTRLDYEAEVEKNIHLEDNKSYEYEEDTEDDLNVADEDRLTELNSILRARLNSQEASQPALDHHSSSAGSPCGTLPSSTTGGDDLDFSPTESSGGARKRAPRALTGKHVRPGTGASASTLLTLRQKLQERQKYREVYGVDPPQPAQTSKARGRKR